MNAERIVERRKYRRENRAITYATFRAAAFTDDQAEDEYQSYEIQLALAAKRGEPEQPEPAA